MGKKGESSETLAQGDGNGFYACYLLISLSPRHKGHSYIGFTVNPKRRIRQHNGEITSGASRTKSRRPWEMVLCIYGFPTHVAALQFEWAWQHPKKSVVVREAASNLKSVSGLAKKIKIVFTMLTLHTWQSMGLTVNFFSTKYMNHVAGCPSLPQQMRVQFGSMDDLPCYSPSNNSLYTDEDDTVQDLGECSERDTLDESARTELTNGISHSFDAAGSSTSIMDGDSSTEEFVGKWDSCISTDDNRYDQDQPSEEMEDEIRTPPFKRTEVIDLFTRSPLSGCRINTCSKKRKDASAFAVEIIDLTRSPVFVQL